MPRIFGQKWGQVTLKDTAALRTRARLPVRREEHLGWVAELPRIWVYGRGVLGVAVAQCLSWEAGSWYLYLGGPEQSRSENDIRRGAQGLGLRVQFHIGD